MEIVPYPHQVVLTAPTVDSEEFFQRRNAAIAALIPTALCFPEMDKKTGYSTVPKNALARLVGLLHCLKCSSIEELQRAIDKSHHDIALKREATATGQENPHEISYMQARHAQTSMESVLQNIPRAESLLSNKERDLEAIKTAVNKHFPQLMEIVQLQKAPEGLAAPTGRALR